MKKLILVLLVFESVVYQKFNVYESLLGRIICVGPSELTLDEEFVDVTASTSCELTDVDVV